MHSNFPSRAAKAKATRAQNQQAKDYAKRVYEIEASVPVEVRRRNSRALWKPFQFSTRWSLFGLRRIEDDGRLVLNWQNDMEVRVAPTDARRMV